MTKTYDLLESLRLLKSVGHKYCIVKGDSRIVICWGKDEKCRSWRLFHFIHEIRDLVADTQAHLHYVPHSQNSVVDRMAKWSAREQLVFVGDHVPK